MRTLVVAVSTAFLLMASAASAVPVVSLVWSGTNGTGTAGSSSIGADVGDMLTLTIFVSNTTPASGISFAGVSLTYGPGLTGGAATECPTGTTAPMGGNLFGGGTTCTPAGFIAPFLSPFILGVTVGGGLATSFDAAAASGATTGTLELGAIKFTVSGADTVSTFYSPGLDSVNDGLGNGLGSVFFPSASASVNVIPEPATAGLLALGLGALGLIGRRRS
jgi:hypothetical protein